MPSVHNPQASQDKLATEIDKLDILRKRYSQAIEYMRWFEPAWSSLSEIEQKVINKFYMVVNQKSGATYRLMDMLKISERGVKRTRGKAFYYLKVMLFG